jgi:hypothetical protein
MTIWIDKETLLWVNINRPYKGRSRLDTPEIRAAVGVVEIADPIKPDDYSDETYYKSETDDFPYVIYTRKPQEQIDQMLKAKALAAIDAVERNAMLPRLIREYMLELPGAASKPWFAKVKALDDDVAVERAKIK